MADAELAVRVLGLVQLHGRPLRSSAASHLLAWTALHRGRPVDLDRCARAVWPELPAASARRRVRDAARALAREFPETASTAGNHFELVTGHDRTDEAEFVRLLACGPGTPGEQDTVTAALRLWRGTPYPGLGHIPLVARRVARLNELRLDALERRFALALVAARGTPDTALVAELRAAVCTHSGRERLWRLLVGSLYLSSRQLEALAELRNGRLGLERDGTRPSPLLDVLHSAVLRGDDSSVLAAV